MTLTRFEIARAVAQHHGAVSVQWNMRHMQTVSARQVPGKLEKIWVEELPMAVCKHYMGSDRRAYTYVKIGNGEGDRMWFRSRDPMTKEKARAIDSEPLPKDKVTDELGRPIVGQWGTR